MMRSTLVVRVCVASSLGTTLLNRPSNFYRVLRALDPVVGVCGAIKYIEYSRRLLGRACFPSTTRSSGTLAAYTSVPV